MAEQFHEHRARYKFGPLEGATDPTRNPRDAGDRYREFQKHAGGNGAGEVVIERRTVTIGDWEPRECTKFNEKGEPKP